MSAKRVTILNLDKNVNSLHVIMSPILMVCRLFGFYPVSNLLNPNHNKLTFVAKSPYTIIWLITLVGHVILCLLSMLNLLKSGSTPRSYYKFITNAGGALSTLMILRLSRKWPQIVHQASIIEETLPKFNKKSISTTCNVIAALVFLGAIELPLCTLRLLEWFCGAINGTRDVEFSLAVKLYLRIAEACFFGNTLAESYYRYTMPWAAQFVPYTPWSFAIIQILNIQIIFISNFADVFIMVASLYLTFYIQELNALITLYKDKYPSIWNVIRGYYTRFTSLVKLLDHSISPFVFVSFGQNLAIICVHLFKILRKDLAHDLRGCNPELFEVVLSSMDRAVYFTFALLFMLSRTLAAALLASRVYSASREPLSVLYEVPSECYCTEAHRFLEQIDTNTVALSGLQFFYVTKGVILSMAASIITYELVMLQFSEN